MLTESRNPPAKTVRFAAYKPFDTPATTKIIPMRANIRTGKVTYFAVFSIFDLYGSQFVLPCQFLHLFVCGGVAAKSIPLRTKEEIKGVR